MNYILTQQELDAFVINKQAMEKRVNELLDLRMLEFGNCVTKLLQHSTLNDQGHFEDPAMRTLIFCIKKAMRECKITVSNTTSGVSAL